MTPSTGTNLPATMLARKLALTLASVGCYWLIVTLAERFDWSATVFGFEWPFHLIGLVFGALVMAPYAAGSPHRIVRMVALAVASAVIYHLAVRFVVDGPMGHSTITPFMVAGSGAALICGMAVVVLAPRSFDWRLIALTLAAGAIGGVAFEWQLPVEWAPNDLHAYVAWQLLVCLALHYGLRLRAA